MLGSSCVLSRSTRVVRSDVVMLDWSEGSKREVFGATDIL
jgi:hypothetical protein